MSQKPSVMQIPQSGPQVLMSDKRDVSITLFPMVHLAEPEFYERINSDAKNHDIVVLEGINSPVSRRLTRAYRWIAPARLGLVVQQKFVADEVLTVHADLPADEFEALWRTGPLWERALVEAGASIMGLWSRLNSTRASLGKNLNTTDLADRDTIMMWNERNAKAGSEPNCRFLHLQRVRSGSALVLGVQSVFPNPCQRRTS